MLNEATAPPERTEAPLAGLVSSAMLVHAVTALLDLGVVDRLEDGPRELADLARETGVPALLRARPEARGVLFDLPEVVAGAGPLLQREGVADRCTVVGDDLFEGVPAGSDLYVMARVLQNWAPEDAVRMLRNVRDAMPGTGRLLVVGHLSDDERPNPFVEAIGLSMYMLYGAPPRTRPEHEELFARASSAAVPPPSSRPTCSSHASRTRGLVSNSRSNRSRTVRYPGRSTVSDSARERSCAGTGPTDSSARRMRRRTSLSERLVRRAACSSSAPSARCMVSRCRSVWSTSTCEKRSPAHRRSWERRSWVK